ncbi:MAG: DUF262 domain-containing protein [Bacteroidales bacterium]|nr:DUF262 domain-containing protein [Bacteroidales bacterium]
MKDYTLLELLENYNIVIPPIQRDYAQGRTSQRITDLRRDFLDDIFQALSDDNAPALRLNFVYGDGDDGMTFIPIDGQQRLTTLFLLHWMLAPDDQLSALRHEDMPTRPSRFSYQVRTSSKDFCDRLVNNPTHTIHRPDAETLLSSAIKNESWYLWEWRSDPTIQSMLKMIDDIEARITPEMKDDMWQRLISGAITFNWLPLHNYHRVNDLFVKMNARGRELSAFDKCKSTIEQLLYKAAYKAAFKDRDEKAMERTHQWGCKVDNQWMNGFWKEFSIAISDDDDEKTSSYKLRSIEEYYLRFLRQMMTLPLYLNITNLWAAKRKSQEILNDLCQRATTGDLTRLLTDMGQAQLLPLFYFNQVERSIDGMMANEGEIFQRTKFPVWLVPKDESLLHLFTLADDELTYRQRTLLVALQCFTLLCPYSEWDRELTAWVRILSNLITQTDIDSENFPRVCQGIYEMAHKVLKPRRDRKDKDSSVEWYFAHGGRIKAMRGVQVEEEQKKAALMLRSPAWRAAILRAEGLDCLRGCLRMLLSDLDYTHTTDDVDFFNTKVDNLAALFPINSETGRTAMTSHAAEDNLLLRSFLGHLKRDESIWRSYPIFNNDLTTWRLILTGAWPDHKDNMEDWRQALTAILSKAEISIPEQPERNYGWIKTLVEDKPMLARVVEMRNCWIRTYHNHTAIYPSAAGIFFDTPLRDMVINELASQRYGHFELRYGSLIEGTTYMVANAVGFVLDGVAYEWNEYTNKVYAERRSVYLNPPDGKEWEGHSFLPEPQNGLDIPTYISTYFIPALKALSPILVTKQ